MDGADRRIARVHGTRYGPLSTKLRAVACSTQLHCGGTKECTGRGECNRAAPDAQRSANAKKDSLTIRAGMACKMIA